MSETVSQETKAEPSGRSLRDRPITPSKSSFQTQEFERIFEQFDLNGDGTLTADEVREVLAVTGMGLSGADRTKLLDRISTGSPLAKQDFLEWLAQREDLDLEADLRTVFALVDQDASGTLSRAELSDLMRCLNPALAAEEIDAAFDRIDLNRDGIISWQEFVSSQRDPQQLSLTLAEVRSFKKILLQYDQTDRLQGVSLVEVDSDLGAGRRGASRGVEFLKQAAIEKQASRQRASNGILGIDQRSVANENDALERAQNFPHAKHIDAIYKVLERSSALVCNVLQEGKFPVVLGGDHSTAAGTIAGIKQAFPDQRLGVIWIDAHADIHSPYTTPSGNMHGMPLSVATGHDNLGEAINQLDSPTRVLWERCKSLGVQGAANLRFEDLIYVAVRDTEAAEDAILERQGIPVVSTAWLRRSGPEAAARQCLEHLSEVDRIYISFDVDSMDATICMGTGTPSPGGLWPSEAMRLNAALVQDPRVCCWEVCEINPVLDTLNTLAENSLKVFEAVLEVLQARPALSSASNIRESGI